MVKEKMGGRKKVQSKVIGKEADGHTGGHCVSNLFFSVPRNSRERVQVIKVTIAW